MKFIQMTLTQISMSPVAIPVLFLMGKTSDTSPNWAKKSPKWSSNMTLVFLVPKYSVWSLTALVKSMYSARSFAASSVASRMSHIALLLLANIFAPIFRASSIIFLLRPISLRVLMFVVNREIVLVFTVSTSAGTGNSSFPSMKFSYFSFSPL